MREGTRRSQRGPAAAERVAVVLAVEGDRAVVLTDNGFTVRVPYVGPAPRVGARYPLRVDVGRLAQADPASAAALAAVLGMERAVVRLSPRPAWRVALVASMLLAVLLATLTPTLAAPVAAITLEFAPGSVVELEVDLFGHVLAERAQPPGPPLGLTGLPWRDALVKALRAAAPPAAEGSPAEASPRLAVVTVARTGLWGPVFFWSPQQTFDLVAGLLTGEGQAATIVVYEVPSAIYHAARDAGETVTRRLLADVARRRGVEDVDGLSLNELLAVAGITQDELANLLAGFRPVIRRLVPGSLVPGTTSGRAGDLDGSEPGTSAAPHETGLSGVGSPVATSPSGSRVADSESRPTPPGPTGPMRAGSTSTPSTPGLPATPDEGGQAALPVNPAETAGVVDGGSAMPSADQPTPSQVAASESPASLVEGVQDALLGDGRFAVEDPGPDDQTGDEESGAPAEDQDAPRLPQLPVPPGVLPVP